jgi:hypothetical protein
VNNALRRMNIVPGPGLKDERALAKPPLPKGPLPEVEWSNFGLGGSGNKETNAEASAQPAAQAAPPAPAHIAPAPAAEIPATPPAMPPAAPQTSAPRD